MGAHFLVYDSSKNPIGEYVSDDRGYVYVEGLSSGRYYVRELDNEGYLVDDELKTVYIRGRGYHRDRMGEHAHHSPDPDLEEVRGRQRHQRLPGRDSAGRRGV